MRLGHAKLVYSGLIEKFKHMHRWAKTLNYLCVMQMKLSAETFKLKGWVLSLYIKAWERALSRISLYHYNIVKVKDLLDFHKVQITMVRPLGESISETSRLNG